MLVRNNAPVMTAVPQTRAQEPAAPQPPVDQVVVQEPAAQEHSLVYKGVRGLLGGAAALTGGTLGAAFGGITNAGDTVIPDKVQKIASKILRPALAAAGAGLGIMVGLASLPLGPVGGALAGTVIGAVVGGAIPGAVDGLAAAGHGAVKGLISGVQKGYHGMTTAFDRVAEKFHHEPSPQPPAGGETPTPPSAPPAEPKQLELPFQ